MFPLRHPLRTPQLAEKPAAQPNASELELTDEYIAELLLREARNSAKLAEKYGVMSYLSGSRVAPVRKEKPDAQFFQNVVRSTIGSSEFQERKMQLQKMQAEEVAYYRAKHMATSKEENHDEKDKTAKRSKKDKKEKKHKKERKAKKEKKEKKSKERGGPSADALKHTSSAVTHRAPLPKVRGRGARAFNPQEPDRAQNDAMYESLPVQREDPPELLAKRRARLQHSSSSSDSDSYSSRSRSWSRSPSPRRRRSPSPHRSSSRDEHVADRYQSQDRDSRRRDRREP